MVITRTNEHGDEYDQEIGHSIDCPFYMIDTMNKPYVKEVSQA